MIDKNNLPRHIAIIMDGNGRWAKARGLPRTAGHNEGAKRVKEIVRVAAELGIEVLTLFAFSAENWSRPKKEIDALMRYLNDFLEREISQLHKNNIKFKAIGSNEPLPEYLQVKIKEAQEKTKNNKGMVLVLALNYGGRQEIVDAVEGFARAVADGKAKIGSLDAEGFSKYLYTSGLADPDLLIRTSGQMRISNFLLWQLSYTELYFPEVYWPDFKRGDLEEAIEEYQKRERRFGGVDVRKKNS
ncbi:MAG: isoprenyl transferase [Candidatus Omnitrophica bacterium]|nr:isoprenyl transferase [Candidatus Omnitrophota bacterium]